MTERVLVTMERGFEGLTSAVLRYGMLERLAKSAALRNVTVLAFGVARRELRLVLDGADADIRNVIRGVKCGTGRAARRLNVTIEWGEQRRTEVTVDGLEEAVAWAHSAPVEHGVIRPLASPWTSHRDLMGYRVAGFFDAGAVRGRVDLERVHQLAEGGPMPGLPTGAPPVRTESLDVLLRIAAGCKGVLPADRRCFALFAQLAGARGHQTCEIATALALTTRRVRQLRKADEPQLEMAMRCLSDARLRVVP